MESSPTTYLEAALGAWDLSGTHQGGAALPSLLSNTTLLVERIDADLALGDLCGAQNLTATALYQNLTHIPLSFSSGIGTTCATSFSPNSFLSPIQSSVGLDSPNTYLGVYVDWALEAEAVPISTSPLEPIRIPPLNHCEWKPEFA